MKPPRRRYRTANATALADIPAVCSTLRTAFLPGVADHEQFPVNTGLPAHRLDRITDDVAAIERRHDHRDERVRRAHGRHYASKLHWPLKDHADRDHSAGVSIPVVREMCAGRIRDENPVRPLRQFRHGLFVADHTCDRGTGLPKMKSAASTPLHVTPRPSPRSIPITAPASWRIR